MDGLLKLLANPAVISVVGLVIADLRLRYAASEKPLSVLHAVADAAKAIAEFVDAVLGQNVAPKA